MDINNTNYSPKFRLNPNYSKNSLKQLETMKPNIKNNITGAIDSFCNMTEEMGIKGSFNVKSLKLIKCHLIKNNAPKSQVHGKSFYTEVPAYKIAKGNVISRKPAAQEGVSLNYSIDTDNKTIISAPIEAPIITRFGLREELNKLLKIL